MPLPKTIKLAIFLNFRGKNPALEIKRRVICPNAAHSNNEKHDLIVKACSNTDKAKES